MRSTPTVEKTRRSRRHCQNRPSSVSHASRRRVRSADRRESSWHRSGWPTSTCLSNGCPAKKCIVSMALRLAPPTKSREMPSSHSAHSRGRLAAPITASSRGLGRVPRDAAKSLSCERRRSHHSRHDRSHVRSMKGGAMSVWLPAAE
jgi:hypothetical protein